MAELMVFYQANGSGDVKRDNANTSPEDCIKAYGVRRDDDLAQLTDLFNDGWRVVATLGTITSTMPPYGSTTSMGLLLSRGA
jgi:hypothetical protein